MYTNHAEHNCIQFAEKARLSGAILFVTHPPCAQCAGKIVDAGIKTVFFDSGDENFKKRWNSPEIISKMQSQGIEMIQHEQTQQEKSE